MPLKDFLFPREVIHYQSTECITYEGDQEYNLYLTDKRLIFFKQTGLFLNRDNIISERLPDIQTMSYKEKGLVFKTGMVSIETAYKTFSFEGNPANIKLIFLELQKFIQPKHDEMLVKEKEVKEKEVVREVVLVPCQYCGSLMPQNSLFCPNCGARRK